MARAKRKSNWMLFVALAALGITSAFFVFVMLALGECLPRDGTAEMHSCDVEKQREFWLYPLLVTSVFFVAIWAQLKGSAWGSMIALSSGILGALLLFFLEAIAS